MIRFSAKFNVSEAMDRRGLLASVGHYLEAEALCVADLSGLSTDGSKPEQILEGDGFTVHVGDYEKALAVSAARQRGDTRTTLSCVLSDASVPRVLSVRLDEQRAGLAIGQDDARPEVPMPVREAFWDELTADDCGLDTRDCAQVLHKADAGRIASLVKSRGNGMTMPIVLLPLGPDGKTCRDKDSIADALVGQAHVLAIGNPLVSQELARLLNGTCDLPEPGGAGVMMPGAPMVLVHGDDYDVVVDGVRETLCRLPLPEDLDPDRLKQGYLRAHMGGDDELSGMFDVMLKEQEDRNDELSKRVFELEHELAAARSQLERKSDGAGGDPLLKITDDELYEGEVGDVILRTLREARDRMADDQRLNVSRKYHVLCDVLEHNEETGTGERKLDAIRRAFADGTLSRDGIAILKSEGFKVTKDDRQGHYKITFGDDTRYTGVHGATPGDLGRCGKNFVADFGNMLFGY